MISKRPNHDVPAFGGQPGVIPGDGAPACALPDAVGPTVLGRTNRIMEDQQHYVGPTALRWTNCINAIMWAHRTMWDHRIM